MYSLFIKLVHVPSCSEWFLSCFPKSVFNLADIITTEGKVIAVSLFFLRFSILREDLNPPSVTTTARNPAPSMGYVIWI